MTSSEPDNANINTTMPRVLREFCWTVATLTVVSFAYCLIAHFRFHLHYPYNWPFFSPADQFNDFSIYESKFRVFHSAAFLTTGYPFTYPAPVALVYETFFKLGGWDAERDFLCFMISAFSIPLLLFWRALRARGLALNASLLLVGCVAVSWPVLLLLDRANMEVVVWVALVIATWAYAKNMFWVAAVFFGLAASLKLFPFVYLALFLVRGRYRYLFTGVAAFAVSTLVSLAILGPTIPTAYHGIAEGLAFFHDNYMGNFIASVGGVDHSPMAFIKASVAAVMNGTGASDSTLAAQARLTNSALRFYLPCMALGGTLLYFLKIKRMPWLNQLLTLSIASIYFTPFSGDGTLVHLYYSFALCCFLAIDAWQRGITFPGLRPIFACFAYLFAIESFFMFHGVRFEGQAKCIGIGILLVFSLRYPLGPDPRGDEDTALVSSDARRVRAAHASQSGN